MGMYGNCPKCGSKGVSRERRPNGNDKCANGHVYLSSEAIVKKPNISKYAAVIKHHSGFTDINGVSICVGDIIQENSKYKYEVCFGRYKALEWTDAQNADYYSEPYGYFFHEINSDEEYHFYTQKEIMESKIKIIGNVHG